MKIAQLCIKRRVMTILTFILIAIFGFVGFKALPLSLMPSMEVPIAIVFTTYAGASPDDIEQQVTDPLESVCASMSGLDTLTSSSSENMSVIVIQFTEDTKIDTAMADLRDKIGMAKSSLPDDAGEPTVMSLDIDSMPVIMVALRGNDLASLQSIADDELSPALSRLDGVASVDVSGGYDSEIAVKTDAVKLKGYNLTVSSVAQQIGADNMAVPGGDLDSGSQTLSVRTNGQYESVNDVKNALISLPTGGTVRLSQIADVSMAHKDQNSLAKVNGEECILLSVNKQSGSNTVDIAERAKAKLDELVSQNAALSWDMLMDQSEFINLSVDNAISNIVFGVIFAALVLFLFLRDFGATTAISIAMPLCILFTFLIMKGLNITLNMMSLGGVALGVGMIVDNSIVVLDNIFRYRADGYDRWDSCTKGAAEVSLSITASTLTTVAVFLPIGLSGGMTGMMFREFCITICALLGSSLIIALTLVPLLCYILLDRGGRHRMVTIPDVKDKFIADKPLMRKYKAVLKLFITRRAVGMLLTVVICVGSIISIGLAGMELIPEMDQGELSVSVGMPTGSSMEETAAIQERIATIATDTIPEMDLLYYTTGNSSSMMSSSSSASVGITLVERKHRDRSAKQVANQLRRDLQDIAGCEITVSSSSSMSSVSGSAISLKMTGKDYDELSQVSNDLAEELSRLPDAVNVKSSAAEQVPRIAVKVNRENASRFGLSAASIGGLVRGELTGSVATKLRMKGEEYDITVSGDDSASKNIDALKSMQLPVPTGGTVPLSMVADVYTELAPQSIERENQNETVTISGDSESGDSAGMATRVNEFLATYDLPDGVEIDDGSSAAADMAETTGTLMLALGAAILLVYFILASQFNSFVLPVAIMLILPIGLLGSMSLLFFTGNKVSMVALLGVIILAGTVVNSSIVLIDYIQQRRDAGEEKNEAILNACPRRVRPVLMTALTTILGLLPMVFSGGEGSEMMKPMAIVMVTGMIISTIATLFITPVYYSLIDSLASRFTNRKKKPKKGQKLLKAEETAE
ncbi:efflux RND transporter permease subunit [Butyricicoccus faecihominis]|uniref:efflux RND transporter permease subunit n=1 Tax=Butyricicoccus faecihominis TaxID=1712515 RepID=UPI00247AFDB1|nr:efflux RND transporter permease subunit [Butyricicoccus faecihominis]MCQ5130004.1 efflux RND transporter permease subunit [Butyricicoccus faecihominis]